MDELSVQLLLLRLCLLRQHAGEGVRQRAERVLRSEEVRI